MASIKRSFDISLMDEKEIAKLESLGFERQGKEITLPEGWTGFAGGGGFLLSDFPHTAPESYLILCDKTSQPRIKVVDLRLTPMVGVTHVREPNRWDRIRVYCRQWLH